MSPRETAPAPHLAFSCFATFSSPPSGKMLRGAGETRALLAGIDPTVWRNTLIEGGVAPMVSTSSCENFFQLLAGGSMPSTCRDARLVKALYSLAGAVALADEQLVP